jgi:hypothetical protein
MDFSKQCHIKVKDPKCDEKKSISGLLFSAGTPVSSTNKTESHDIAEILLKVALNTINLNPMPDF